MDQYVARLEAIVQRKITTLNSCQGRINELRRVLLEEEKYVAQNTLKRNERQQKQQQKQQQQQQQQQQAAVPSRARSGSKSGKAAAPAPASAAKGGRR